MRIVADENIPFIREACEGMGEVTLAAGRSFSRDLVAGADCLFVRSVTKVHEGLLDGSSVRFVGTATIGMDHVDGAYLERAGIGFASAPGSNANSVSEYVAAALLYLAVQHDFALTGKTIGVIGAGNVGTRVARKAEALGMRVLLNDPPRAAREGADGFVGLEELLARADVVTLHTPLERKGDWPTFHLADDRFFAGLRRGAIFINSARGMVHDSAALIRAIDNGTVAHAVLDVWEHEPEVDPELLRRVALASPHIAGYSFDGKVNGTTMVVNAARDYFCLEGHWRPGSVLPETTVPECALARTEGAVEPLLLEVTRKLYDSRDDDSGMRRLLDMPLAERAAWFDMLRRDYRTRREWIHTLVTLPPKNASLARALEGLGFRVMGKGKH